MDKNKLDALNEGHLKAKREKENDFKAMAAVEEFLEHHKMQVLEWSKTNPGERPPVYYIEKENRVVWLNRKKRRIQRAKEMKAQRISDRLARDLYNRSKMALVEKSKSKQELSPLAKINSLDENLPREASNESERAEPIPADTASSATAATDLASEETSDATACEPVV